MTEAILDEFTNSFFGYGSLDAPNWFVGMEEGGGKSKAEIESRLRSWDAAERAAVVDIVEFGSNAGLEEHLQWFQGERPPLQSTWMQLIRMVLARGGASFATSSVRTYQRDAFARTGGGECLLELMPLPSPSVGDWHYDEWFNLPWLRSRSVYQEHMLERRVERLAELVDCHNPEAVVFYSRTYLDHWCRIVGAAADHFEQVVVVERDGREDLTALVLEQGNTKFVVCSHPGAFGVTNSYFERIGKRLAQVTFS
jgi:hypothetical protein